jgi:hypothetical protein
MQVVTIRVVRLLAISLTLATALAATPALAGWRDGPYYGDDWGGDYYPPARAYRPAAPVYRDDYQPNYGYDRRPWAGRQAYAPGYYDEPEYFQPDEDMGPPVRPRVMRPPRNISAMPAQPRRVVPVKPRTVVLPSAKTESLKPKVAAAPVAKPEPVQVARALPVPRPNLESMDFEPATPEPAK